MGEFLEVMKQKKRMCEKYKDGGICQSIDYNICPLKGHELCSKPITLINVDKIQEGEEIIMRWAAEHPEPVYPTWGEFLVSVKAIYEKWDDHINDYDNAEYAVKALRKPIPVDIAQKLGIEPKEG